MVWLCWDRLDTIESDAKPKDEYWLWEPKLEFDQQGVRNIDRCTSAVCERVNFISDLLQIVEEEIWLSKTYCSE